MSAFPQGAFITLCIVNVLGLFIGDALLRGVELEGIQRGLIVGLVLAILNVTLGAILDFLTTPVRWITLGLFAFIIDAIVIMLASRLMKGFAVSSFVSALGLAIVIALTNVLFDWVF